MAIVVGGGNFFRGATAYEGLERATADYVGMLATCMNSIMLQVCAQTLMSLWAFNSTVVFSELNVGYIACSPHLLLSAAMRDIYNFTGS